MHILACLRIGTEADGRSSYQRTNVVGLLNTGLGVPGDVVLVREMCSQDGGTVIPSKAHE